MNDPYKTTVAPAASTAPANDDSPSLLTKIAETRAKLQAAKNPWEIRELANQLMALFEAVLVEHDRALNRSWL